jgi:RNA polymerase sigma-70 factor, ECF subfamily
MGRGRTLGESGKAQGPLDFASWYQHEHPKVVAALTVTSGDAEVAVEATDEAFVRAYERWSRVRRMASPGGWLYRVALNVLRRRTRRRARERALWRRLSAPAPSPDGAAAPAALDAHVWDAVRDLPPRQRTAVALRYVLDLPETEVARLMGISRGAASASLSTARRHLEATLLAAEAEALAGDGAAVWDGWPARPTEQMGEPRHG